MKVDTCERDSHGFDLSEFFLDGGEGGKVITEFVGEDSGELFGVVFLDRETPQDLRRSGGGGRKDLLELRDGVGGGEQNLARSYFKER